MRFVLLLCLFGSGCTDNIAAKSWGGSTTMEIADCQKVVNVTWKDANLWCLTRPFHEGDVAETYSFKEDSAYGVLNGTVTIKEHCAK